MTDNLKQIAAEIYAESRKLPTGSEATRYRQKMVREYSKDDRYFLNAYLEQLKKSNRVSGLSPSSEFNRGKS